MDDQNYSLPLAPDRIMAGLPHPKSPEKEAIHQHLYLLMVTHFDESRFDSRYGCALWNHDFAVMSQIKWKDLIRESMEEAVRLFERRLVNVKVRVEMEEFEVLTKTNNYVRKRVGIEIKATIKRTNEPFVFFERIFISPLSIE